MNKSTSELLEIMKSKKDFEEYYREEINEFYFENLSEYLNFLVKSKGLKKSDIFRKGNLNEDYAYQFFNGNKGNPSRNKILMLAFGMELSYEETAKLLKITKQPELYVRDLRDSVIIHGLDHGESIISVNERLENYGLDILE